MKKIIVLFGVIIVFICLFGMGKINNENTSINDQKNLSTNQEVVKQEVIRPDVISDDVISLLSEYPDFKRVLKHANIAIPTINDFIPQGITLMNDYYVISGYYENSNNSKCYVIDQKGELINEVELDTTSHVGAIYYDSKNNLIWIPDNDGVVSIYNANDFLVSKKVSSKDKFKNISEGLTDYQDKNKLLIAYLTIDDDYLYIGNFYKTKSSIVKKFKITSNEDKINLEYVSSFNVPMKTQSIYFYETNNEKYLIVSNSHNRRTRSHIYIYKYDETVNDYADKKISSIEIPPMSEDITIKNDRLHILFESTASKYPNAIDKVGKICEIDLKEIIK